MEFTFLMCSERSGSNLITKILDSHPFYCGPSPTHLFRILIENRHRYGNLADDKKWKILLSDIILLLETMTGVWSSKWNIDLLSESVQERSLSKLLRVIYETEAEVNKKSKLFVKENHLYRFLPYILSEFRDSKIIYLVRDPRDMALSWKLSPSLRGCVMRAANTWQRDQSEGIKLFSSLSEFDSILLIRYEDLLTNSESKLIRMCDFLGIDFDDRMLRFQNNEAAKQNAKRSKDWKNINKPLMKSNFNKYRNGLTTEEIQYIERICRDEMDILGYIRENDCEMTTAELELQIWHLEQIEKPVYQLLPENERMLRQKRADCVKRIRDRKPVPFYL